MFTNLGTLGALTTSKDQPACQCRLAGLELLDDAWVMPLVPTGQRNHVLHLKWLETNGTIGGCVFEPGCWGLDVHDGNGSYEAKTTDCDRRRSYFVRTKRYLCRLMIQIHSKWRNSLTSHRNWVKSRIFSTFQYLQLPCPFPPCRHFGRNYALLSGSHFIICHYTTLEVHFPIPKGGTRRLYIGIG